VSLRGGNPVPDWSCVKTTISAPSASLLPKAVGPRCRKLSDLVPKDKMRADTGGQSEDVLPDVVVGRTSSGVEEPGNASLL
jgi:hypothetical protein